ncbi:hypothetical protein EV421DRAFT_1903340 [Armillaria borealis]|uniref:Uncharacterized protein n=1 Tax=Armillaria borealis TaxID=47425 RepID=A0AA39JL50_9AGAR|nr:hypothetical protein EV421DRAFT_1903340 [Armillaria borealis]
MSAPETKFAPTQSSSVLGGQIVGRSERQAVAPPAALKLRLDLNLEVEIAIQAKVNGDITLSLLLGELGLRCISWIEKLSKSLSAATFPSIPVPLPTLY